QPQRQLLRPLVIQPQPTAGGSGNTHTVIRAAGRVRTVADDLPAVSRAAGIARANSGSDAADGRRVTHTTASLRLHTNIRAAGGRRVDSGGRRIRSEGDAAGGRRVPREDGVIQGGRVTHTTANPRLRTFIHAAGGRRASRGGDVTGGRRVRSGGGVTGGGCVGHLTGRARAVGRDGLPVRVEEAEFGLLGEDAVEGPVDEGFADGAGLDRFDEGFGE